MKFTKTLLASSVLAASSMVATSVYAGSPITSNISVTSNYIFRGVTQTSDRAAVQGGIDYAHDSGFYVGAWWSNFDAGTAGQYEQDLYVGYGFDAGPVGLDVGYIKYMYPVGNVALDISELYLNASYQMITAGIAYTIDQESNPASENNIYLYVSAEFEVRKDLTLGLTYGDYDVDGTSAGDYSHIQVSLSKGDFSLAYDDNDMAGAAGDPRISVSWSKGFDL